MNRVQRKEVLRTGVLVMACLFASVASWAVSSRAGSADDLGVGIAFGQPMGFTGKYWLSQSTALDGFIGYHFNGNMDVHVDHLWHTFSSFQVTQGRMPFYVGLGARALLGGDSQLGVRFPLGVTYLFANDPMDVFLELAPLLKVVPDTGFDMDGMIGVRFYLNYTR